MVASIRPPITARPSGAFCSPASPRPSAIGIMPRIIAIAVIRIGRSRVRPASITASSAERSWRARISLAKLTTRIEFDTEMPTDMIAPISNSTLMVVPVSASIHRMPIKRARHRHHDDQRVDPGLEQHHQQRIDQHDRQDQAFAQIGEGGVHHLVLAADVDVRGGGKRRLQLVDHALDVGGHAAQIAAVDIGVDVDDALHRVVVDRLHVGIGRDRGDVGQPQVAGAPGAVDIGWPARRRAAIGMFISSRHGGHLRQRHLHGDEIIHAIDGAEEEGRRDCRRWTRARSAGCWPLRSG